MGSFGYSESGNPATYKSTAITFDAENRLTSFNTTTLKNGYTGDSLRAWKQNASGKTYFLYAGTQPVCEFNAGGTLTATNTYDHVGLVSRRASNTSTFYTFDPQGSVAQRLNASGGVLSSDTGDAFGSRATTGSGDVFGYVGQWGYYTDAETGLCLCQHRYYDPATGRFVTRDPTGYKGGINLYSYCQNSGVNAVDPTGFGDPLESILEGIASCEALLIGDTIGRSAQDTCADIGACVGAAIVSYLNIQCGELGVWDAVIFECLANAIGQAAANYVTEICNDVTDPCPKPMNLCQFESNMYQAICACAEGALGAGMKAIGLGILQDFLDPYLDEVISSDGGANETKCAGEGG